MTASLIASGFYQIKCKKAGFTDNHFFVWSCILYSSTNILMLLMQILFWDSWVLLTKFLELPYKKLLNLQSLFPPG